MANSTKTTEHKYVPGHQQHHIKLHTMRTAENSSAYLLPTLQTMAKSQPRLKLLDCGAGPGSISVSLARYLPEGEVTATDLSEDIVQRAAAYAQEQGAANVKCEVASIYDLPYPDNSFDVVHVQQVREELSRTYHRGPELTRSTGPHSFGRTA
jgi:2-polyprenyl-3-methyl-5-hydroxy-6-metoxy-1,4-benzoquinol methylase